MLIRLVDIVNFFCFGTGMKSIKFNNEDGETIELRRGMDGEIKIRHSRHNRRLFGDYHEFAGIFRHPKMKEILAKRGIDPESRKFKKGLEMIKKSFSPAYMQLKEESLLLSDEEVGLIRAAIPQLD